MGGVGAVDRDRWPSIFLVVMNIMVSDMRLSFAIIFQMGSACQ